MSNTRHTRPGLRPVRRKSSIPDAYERKRPVYKKDIRAARERILADREAREWLNSEG